MKKRTVLGAAAVVGFMSSAHAMPITTVNLGHGVQKVGLMDGYSDLHAPPGGPGFWGKGAGAAPPARHHRHR